MKISAQTISVTAIIGILFGLFAAYIDVRDRLTRMETQLEILAPVAVDHMVAIELEKRGRTTVEPHAPVYRPPRFGEEIRTSSGTVGGDGTLPPGHPPIGKEELEKIRKEKQTIYQQRSLD